MEKAQVIFWNTTINKIANILGIFIKYYKISQLIHTQSIAS